jgi:hypothetical protein
VVMVLPSLCVQTERSRLQSRVDDLTAELVRERQASDMHVELQRSVSMKLQTELMRERDNCAEVWASLPRMATLEQVVRTAHFTSSSSWLCLLFIVVVTVGEGESWRE